jgi:hypothetical protein
VLQNYTTYKRFFGLVKRIQQDPEVPKKAAARALGQFLEMHPVNIEQVVQVIIEHFRLKVMHELGGRAKAMVVTASRLSAVKYKKAFDGYIKDKGYSGIRALVAFSGTVEDPDLPGFKRIVIRPYPLGDLRWIRAEYKSHYGLIRSSWNKDNGTLTLKFTVPVNTTARVYIPARNEASITVGEKQAATAEGVKFARKARRNKRV